MVDVRKLVAEFLGTAILVFAAVGTATLSFGFKFAGLSPSAGVVTTALAFGVVLVAMVYAIGPVSGCHINPAVTISMVISGRMKITEGIFYWVAQVAGGIAGAYSLYAVFEGSPIYSKQKQGLGTDGYGAQSMIHLGQSGAFAAEVILTFIFVSVVLFATHKAAFTNFAGVAIGLGLTMVHLVGIPLTGTSVNPARSIGPALVVGGVALSQLWLFIVAPLLGGIIAGGVYCLLRSPEAETETLAPVTTP